MLPKSLFSVTIILIASYNHLLNTMSHKLCDLLCIQRLIELWTSLCFKWYYTPEETHSHWHICETFSCALLRLAFYSSISPAVFSFPNLSNTIVLYLPGKSHPPLCALCGILLFEGEIKWNRQNIRFSTTKHSLFKIKALIPFPYRIKRQLYTGELDFPGPFINQVDTLQSDYTDPMALFAVSRQPPLGSCKCLIRLS